MTTLNWFFQNVSPVCGVITYAALFLPIPLVLYIRMVEIINLRTEAKSWKEFFDWINGSYADYRIHGYGDSLMMDFFAIIASLSALITVLTILVRGILYHPILLVILIICIWIVIRLMPIAVENIKKHLN
ncbi:MAG: hypothetical protein PHE24_00870 [Patescibacteria group bacterium]|nr:hypothetical protein [Patescibacteria group bacterium]